jgi:hypothetical protein
MGGRKVLCLMAVRLLCQGNLARAATTACVIGDPGALRPPAGPYVRSTTDPATGARIVLRRDSKGQVSFELTNKDVSIRKTLDGATSVTTFMAGGHVVSLSLAGNQIVVTGSGRRLKGTASQLETVQASAEYLRHSPVAIAAKRLLDRAALRPDVLEGNALLLTRALLGSLWGESTGMVQYQHWAQAAAARTRVVKAVSSAGPGECWDSYAAEAIRIMNDYLDCGNGCGWSGYFCLGSCGFVYDVRAEGAFVWFMSCNGGFFVGWPA